MIALKRDGEPALTNIQQEVQERRNGKTALENRQVGDSRTKSRGASSSVHCGTFADLEESS